MNLNLDNFFRVLEFYKSQPIVIFEFFSGFLPLIVLIFTRNFKIDINITLYSIAIFLLEIIAFILSLVTHNNHKVYLIFYIAESILLYFYYRKCFYKSIPLKYAAILIGFIILLFLNNYFFKNTMDGIAGSMQSLGFIIITVIVFYHVLNEVTFKNIFDSSLFYINIGNLFYFSGKLFVFTVMERVNSFTSTREATNLWLIVSLLLIFQRICIGIGIYKLKYNKTNQIHY